MKDVQKHQSHWSVDEAGRWGGEVLGGGDGWGGEERRRRCCTYGGAPAHRSPSWIRHDPLLRQPPRPALPTRPADTYTPHHTCTNACSCTPSMSYWPDFVPRARIPPGSPPECWWCCIWQWALNPIIVCLVSALDCNKDLAVLDAAGTDTRCCSF